jgi:hypothetical protein
MEMLVVQIDEKRHTIIIRARSEQWLELTEYQKNFNIERNDQNYHVSSSPKTKALNT